MMTLDELRGVWSRLAGGAADKQTEQGVPTEKLGAPQLAAGQPTAALDHDGRKHLLLPIPKNLDAFGDQQSAGVQIFINTWDQSTRPLRVVDIVCQKPHLSDLFDLIAVEILERLPDSLSRPDAAARGVLNRWRELIGHEPSAVPERTAIVGLLGELTLLHHLCSADPAAFQTWIGPNGARHDFASSSTVIEVKSTLQKGSLILAINGVDQLLPPPGSDLLLYVQRFEDAPVNGKSVSEMVDLLCAQGVDRVALLAKLVKVGFPLHAAALTRDHKFRLVSTVVYEVNSAFPRIVPASFVGGALPPGVTAVEYKIDLSAPPPHPLTENVARSRLQQFLGGIHA